MYFCLQSKLVKSSYLYSWTSNSCSRHTDCQAKTKVEKYIAGGVFAVFNNGVAHTGPEEKPSRGIDCRFTAKIDELISKGQKPFKILAELSKWYNDDLEKQREKRGFSTESSSDWQTSKTKSLSLLPTKEQIVHYRRKKIEKVQNGNVVADKNLKNEDFLRWCNEHELLAVSENRQKFDALDDNLLIVLESFQYDSVVNGKKETAYGCIWTTKKLILSLYHFYLVHRELGLHLASDGISIITY